MRVKSEFSKSGMWSYHVTPPSGLTKEELQETINAYVEVAENLGIEIAMRSTVDDLAIDFRTDADRMVFQEAVMYLLGNNVFYHEEDFSARPPEFQAAWTKLASEALEEVGIAHRIEVEGSNVSVYFRTALAMLMFNKIAASGYFGAKAKALLRNDAIPSLAR